MSNRQLLEHIVKFVERVLTSRVKQEVKIDGMQFCFVEGEGSRHYRHSICHEADAREIQR